MTRLTALSATPPLLTSVRILRSQAPFTNLSKDESARVRIIGSIELTN